MSTKANQIPAKGEEHDQSKVKAFRTSTRLKLPPREEKPEDDSVYDRFLGPVEKEEVPKSVSIESERREVFSNVEPSTPSPSTDVVNLRQIQQAADSNLQKHKSQNVEDIPLTDSTSSNRGFNIDLFLRDINKVYRLNSGESVVLRFLVEMSHAQGKDECEVTVPRIMAQTKLTEQRVRRNLKSLRNKGWIRLIKEFDPYKHSAAIYKIFLSPT